MLTNNLHRCSMYRSKIRSEEMKPIIYIYMLHVLQFNCDSALRPMGVLAFFVTNEQHVDT